MRLPSIGDVVGAKYRLDEVIGRGGFATVYRGTDTTVDRQVAVKVLTPGEQGYALTVASRFTREARVLAGLSDAHTLRMFDFGRTDDGVLYMVFELLGGEDLSRYVKRAGPMPVSDVEHVLRQILSSLREAHHVGLLHRDIKPDNIRVFEYMGDRLRTKLMDFGIARQTGGDAVALTRTGAVVGTPRYMSPEQLTGGTLTPASDLYSLALVAHFMLTGERRPSSEAFTPPPRIELPAAPALAAVLNRMLAVDARQRFQSAEQVLAALSAPGVPAPAPAPAPAPTHVEPVEPPVPSPPTIPEQMRDEPPSKPSRRRPIALLVGLNVAVVAIIGVVLYARPAAQLEPRPDDGRISRALQTQPAVTAAPTPTPSAADTPPAAASSADAGVDPDLSDSKTVDGCGREVATGDSDHGLVMGLSRQDWITYVPKGYDPEVRHPLLFFFHGTGTSAMSGLQRTRLRELADREDAVIVAPRDEELFPWEHVSRRALRQVHRQTLAAYCIDTERVFALGHDTGGFAVDALSCEPWLTAIATTSFRPQEKKFFCPNPRPIPSLFFVPLDSGHLRVEGGMSCTGLSSNPSAADQEEMWRDRNRCTTESKVYFKTKHGVCREWTCSGARLASCRVHGGHNWPGAPPRGADLFNCDGEPPDFPLAQTIWSFFESVAPDQPSTEPARGTHGASEGR